MALMSTRSIDPAQVEATNSELYGLYDIRNTAYLNLRYYGSRAASWSSWNTWLQVIAAVESLGAVTVFLALGTDPLWKWISAGVGVLSAICAVLPAIIGHAEKVNRFEKLHFAYCELFELTKRTLLDIKRAGNITVYQVGQSALLNDLASRLGRLDDSDQKTGLRNRVEKEVRERFPVDSLWYADANVQEGTAYPATAPTGAGAGAKGTAVSP